MMFLHSIKHDVNLHHVVSYFYTYHSIFLSTSIQIETSIEENIMMQINKSNHAQVRMQQRGVNSLMVEALSIYGDEIHQKGGVVRLTFTKHGFEKFKKYLKKINTKLEKMKSLFAVEDGGNLITVGYQTKKLYK